MLRVGITGGIGTGKSFVCQLFKVVNIPVYDADAKAKWLCENNPVLIQKIKKLLGDGAYTQHGKYNKAFVAKTIFSNNLVKEKLEELIHPVVLQDGEQWFEKLAEANTYPYAIKEAALLFESGSYKYLDKIIVVDAPLEIRILRVQSRDKISREEIVARMQNQWQNEEKVKRADYLIHNDGVQAVIPQVLSIHKKLLVVNRDKNKA
jgi:dephospho-CoA kinase